MTAWQDYPFPAVIAEKTAGEAFETDSIGRSDSAVLLFEDKVLKIEKTSSVSDNEYAILQWLDGRLRTPRVVAFARENGFNYLLMTKLDGKMAFAAEMTQEEISAKLAEGLKLLRNTDISDCPCSKDFRAVLQEAKRRLEMVHCMRSVRKRKNLRILKACTHTLRRMFRRKNRFFRTEIIACQTYFFPMTESAFSISEARV